MPSGEMRELRGWLFDIYPDQQDGAVVWFIGEDGRRHRLTQHFPITFYAAGASDQLRAAWKYLRSTWPDVHLEKTQRRELFEGLIDVLAMRVENPALQPRVFHRLHDLFPGLEYYDANISLPLLYHSTYDVFPLAHCRVQIDGMGRIQGVQSLDDRWALEVNLPALRTLHLHPDQDPSHVRPSLLKVTYRGERRTLPVREPERLLSELGRLIEEIDPDLIATLFGDRWLFPYLFSISRERGIPFNPNREKGRPPVQVKANTFSSYGRIIHRDRQTLLLGRIHIDPQNSMAFEDTGLAGTFEQARITGLPLQNVARRSPGGGFTAMQIREALQNDILVPFNKKQRERYQSAASLVVADNGGVIFQPITGLHRDVAEIDFFSMYPSLMSHRNISPETVGVFGEDTYMVPGIQRPVSQDVRGVVPAILEPVLHKRRKTKQKLRENQMPSEQKEHMESVSASLKWLGWVSYGYQGFSGNRIGSIEGHEAINAISRDLILKAKEAAEDMGFVVLHMYVDSLFLAKLGLHAREDFLPLVQEMQKRTELRLDIEGVFRWIAFLPSKQDENLPVPNCFFGAFYDGRLKCRGIMARRGDTPKYVKDAQMRAIKILAREKDFERLRERIPTIVNYFRREVARVKTGEVSPAQLTIDQRLSKNLGEFKVFSAAARAARQLSDAGKSIGAGQTVRYLRTVGNPDVLAWELATSGSQPFELDRAWYVDSLLRAAYEILQPLGVPKEVLGDWLISGSGYYQPQDFAAGIKGDLPLFEACP